MPEITVKNIKEVQEILLNWYSINKRVFPWREEGLTEYQIIIAELLLQRTKAETVSRFYEQFIEDFPNWDALASSDLTILEKYLTPIGLYRQRAKRLLALSIEMKNRKGMLPKTRKELESIPFFGQYIVNAIEVLIFEKSSPFLDVNMSRFLERYFGERKLADIRYDPYLQSLALNVVTHDHSKMINWAILDFAALVCKARNPYCSSCELKVKCSYYRTHFNR